MSIEKEIVIIMGIQASGKSTAVKSYTDRGYVRLNRDDTGGSLDQLNVLLEGKIKQQYSTRFVLDNTYGKKEQRAQVIALAKKYGFNVVCHMMKTSIEEAQFNAANRILSLPSANGVIPSTILGPNGSKLFPDPANIPVIALFAYNKIFESPTLDEGFTEITAMNFKRVLPKNYTNKAIILDYDGTLRKMIGKNKFPVTPDEVVIMPNRKEVLNKWKSNGYLLLGISNQSGIEKGQLSDEAAKACFNRTNELLGLDIDYQYCPHHSFPIRCYCRKPLPGLSVYFIRKYLLNPSECIFVGDSTSDKTCAKRSGFQYQDQKDFFA